MTSKIAAKSTRQLLSESNIPGGRRKERDIQDDPEVVNFRFSAPLGKRRRLLVQDAEPIIKVEQEPRELSSSSSSAAISADTDGAEPEETLHPPKHTKIDVGDATTLRRSNRSRIPSSKVLQAIDGSNNLKSTNRHLSLVRKQDILQTPEVQTSQEDSDIKKEQPELVYQSMRKKQCNCTVLPVLKIPTLR
ncbi:hypothetical protein ABKN59_009741 [Abortiporus biennis]